MCTELRKLEEFCMKTSAVLAKIIWSARINNYAKILNDQKNVSSMPLDYRNLKFVTAICL